MKREMLMTSKNLGLLILLIGLVHSVTI